MSEDYNHNSQKCCHCHCLGRNFDSKGRAPAIGHHLSSAANVKKENHNITDKKQQQQRDKQQLIAANSHSHGPHHHSPSRILHEYSHSHHHDHYHNHSLSHRTSHAIAEGHISQFTQNSSHVGRIFGMMDSRLAMYHGHSNLYCLGRGRSVRPWC